MIFDPAISANKDKAFESAKANEQSAKAESKSIIEDTSAVMEQGDNPNPNEVKDPRTFSLQPLAEAYKLAGGVSPQQREISTQARVMEAAVKDGEERVDIAAPLAESKDQSKPESLAAGFDRTKGALKNAIDSSVSYLQREGNLTLSAQNGIRLSSLQGTTITGANTFLSSATTVINSQVSANASESVITLADFSLTRINGSSTTHVEDTAQLSVTNNITRATETSQVIAARTYNHGIDLNSSTGSTMISTAGQGGHTIHSTGNVSTFTDSSITNLATEAITMGAGSPTSNGPNPQAEANNTDIFSAIQEAASFIRVVAGESAGITSVTSGDSSTVSKGSQLTTASNTYTSAASTAAQVAGRQLMNGVMGTGGNARSHVFHQGSMIIQGRMIGGFPSVDIDAIRFPTVPPLPPKPSSYTLEDLQNCIIPKKEEGDEGEGEISIEDKLALEALKSLGIDPSIIRKNAKSPSTSGASQMEVKPGETGTEQDFNTTNSEMSDNDSSITSKVNSSIGTSIKDIISATSSGGGPLNIYPDIYEDKKEEDISEEESVVDNDEELTESIWNSIKEEVEDKDREIIEFIFRDLYGQGYRGEIEPGTIESYINNVIAALIENNKEADRQLIKRTISLIQKHISLYSMGMFQDLGTYPSISLPHIGSIGQIVQESFGINPLNSILGNLRGIGDFSGTASSILSGIGVDIDLSSLESLQDIREFIQNPSLSDLLQNQAINRFIQDAVGNQAPSFTPLINQILNRDVPIEDDELEDLIINVARNEGVETLLPSNYSSLLTESIRSLINGESISLDQNEVLELISSLGSNSMPFKILSGYREIESIISNVSALSSIPDLLSLMQDNDVPILARASLLLSCLDIFNRVRSLIGSFDSLLNLLSEVEIGGNESASIAEEDSLAIKEAFDQLSNSIRPENTLPEDSSLILEHPIKDINNGAAVVYAESFITEYLVIPVEKKLNLNEINRDRSSVIDITQDIGSLFNVYLIEPFIQGKEVEVLDARSADLILDDESIYIFLDKDERRLFIRPDQSSYFNNEEIRLITSNNSVSYVEGNPSYAVPQYNQSSEQNTFYLELKPRKYYSLSELILIEGEDRTLWSNPYWELNETEEGVITYTKRLNPIKETTQLSIDYQGYKLNLRESRDINSYASKFIESLPKFIQFMNLIDRASYKDILSSTDLGLYKGEANLLLLLKSNTLPKLKEIEKSVCFPIPQLDIYESEIEVISVTEAYINFSYRQDYLIGINSVIQLEVNEYSTPTYQRLKVESNNSYYNPTYINYRVTKFSKREGVGLAMIEINQRLILEDERGILFKYYTRDIGKKIFPIIISSYLVQ